jgi:hypothetical protein
MAFTRLPARMCLELFCSSASHACERERLVFTFAGLFKARRKLRDSSIAQIAGK